MEPMDFYGPLAAKLAAGERVLIDGATGTEVERLGVPMTEGAWSGDVVRTHPAVLRQVHASHILAGAEVIITNSFGTSRHLLDFAGIGDRFELLNRRSVEVALEARAETGANVAVAASMSVSKQLYDWPDLEVARKNYLDQGKILADAGADFIILEMMRDGDHTRACAEGALATGLPVWVGWSCEGLNDVGEPMMADRLDSFRPSLEETRDLPFEAALIMHTEVAEVDACLDMLGQYWSGPTGVYAHSGRFEHPNWIFNDVISIEDYAASCFGWMERGVQIIGGCCGITCDHIAALQPMLA